MSPATLKIILFAAEQLLLESPAAFEKLRELFSRETVTLEDLQSLRAEIESGHYKDFVPDTQIPPEQQT